MNFNKIKDVYLTLTFESNLTKYKKKGSKTMLLELKCSTIELQIAIYYAEKYLDFINNIQFEDPAGYWDDYVVNDIIIDSKFFKLKNEEIIKDLGFDKDAYHLQEYWAKTPEGSIKVVRTGINNAAKDKNKETGFEIDYSLLQTLSPVKGVQHTQNNKVAVMCLFDVHIGKIDVHEKGEVLLSNKLFFNQHVSNLIERLPEDIEQVVLPIGNDFFNVDNIFLGTTKGTPQDNVLSVQEMFKTGLECLVSLIRTLTEQKGLKVFIPVVHGNHDKMLTQVLGVSLQQIFSLNENVSFDLKEKPTKYFRYGNNLICFDHGELKGDQYWSKIVEERPHDYVECEYVELLLGHLHHEKHARYKPTAESKSLSIRNLSSLTGTDRWHNNNGYIGSTRRAYVIIYDSIHGRCAELISQSSNKQVS